jgi:tetratricopeptide (TPR) repeat protein
MSWSRSALFRMSALRQITASLICFVTTLVAQAPNPGQASLSPQSSLISAEEALRKKDYLLAESEYHFAAARALSALGNLASTQGQWDEALTAFSEASQNLSDPTEPLLGVATVYLQQEKPKQAELVLHELSVGSRNPRILQLMAVSYAAQNQFQEALQQISEARGSAPADPEIAYVEGVIAVQSGSVPKARQAFTNLLRLRPGAATHVLIGRTWRDYDRVPEAEQEFHEALRIDPHIPRANYYLGTMLLRRQGGLDDAIVAFRRELEVAPEDYLTNLNAGVALLAGHQEQEAIPRLAKAAKLGRNALPLYYLGQAQFQAGQMAGAADSLKRYLAAGDDAVANLGNAEYVLAQALRGLGKAEEAAPHFVRARELKEKYHVESQEQLEQYMAAGAASQEKRVSGIWKVSADPLPASEVNAARRDLVDIVARSYFNLGVILSQRHRDRAAAATLYRAAKWEPGFPNVQASLGTARFQAGMYDLAIDPLRQAIALDANNRTIARLLALSCFHVRSYACAVEMLQQDPGVGQDANLQYALGVSLVNVGKAGLAAKVFSEMIRRSGGSAELYALLGDANAQQGDFDAALAEYQRAVQLNPNVLGANLAAALVLIRQGNLVEAEQHLRAELNSTPTEPRARYHLAYVYEREGKKDEAAQLLRELLKQTPAHPNARYLLGRILLDQGDAAGAVEQLEASMRLAPEEPRVHYQLGRAYQKLGRQDEAKKQFALFQQLKHSGQRIGEGEQAQ